MPGNLSAIEVIRADERKPLDRPRQDGLPDNVAGIECRAVILDEDLLKSRVVPELFETPLVAGGGPRQQLIAVTGDARRRFEELRPGQGAVLGMEPGWTIVLLKYNITSSAKARKEALEKHIERDNANCHISEISSLGLVQMTRKRTRESLEHILCSSCPTCGGRGSVKTAETVCYEIFREILREARQFDSQQLLVLAAQEVVDLLLDEESTSLAELEAFIDKPIKFQVEALYTQEQFDVVLL